MHLALAGTCKESIGDNKQFYKRKGADGTLANFEELRREGEDFRDSGFTELPKPAQLQVLTYMRGLQDGMKIAQESGEKKEPVAV